MGATTGIEWTDATWNPVGGCSIASPGCTNCYAQRTAGTRLKDHPLYAGTTTPSKAGPVFNGRLTAAPDGHPVWTWPLRWRGSPKARAEGRRSRIFVGDMSDLFHEDRPDAVIDRVFAIMALCPQHDFQLLTKRADRMRAYLTDPATIRRVDTIVWDLVTDDAVGKVLLTGSRIGERSTNQKVWPRPNVWLGVSAERQQEADARIPHLLATPAAVRFVSAEPLLGPIDLEHIAAPDDPAGEGWTFDALATGDFYTQRIEPLLATDRVRWTSGDGPYRGTAIDWVIVGGESGPGARPMHPDWVRSIRDQCQAAGVPFFFKQWGEWAPVTLRLDEYGNGAAYPLPACSDPRHHTGDRECLFWQGDILVHWPSVEQTPAIGGRRLGKHRAGRLLDGRTWSEFPSPDRAPSSPGTGEGDHPKDGGRGPSVEGFDAGTSPPTGPELGCCRVRQSRSPNSETSELGAGPPSPDGEGYRAPSGDRKESEP